MSLNISQQFMKEMVKMYFGLLKNSGVNLNKLKSRDFLASGLSTYDFSTLYTTLPHNLIKEKLTELIEQTYNREGSLYYTPRKLCLWWGILFSRCPCVCASVRPSVTFFFLIT